MLAAACAPLAPTRLAPFDASGAALRPEPRQAPQVAAGELAERINAIIDRAPLNRAHWGIEIFDPASDQVLYHRNANKHFIPASNLKLVVAAAALHALGPEYRYSTTVYGTGAIRGGTLEGDVVLFGRGDPTLSGRYAATRTAIFEALADSLRARGVRRVAGGVVADESHWDTIRVRDDWERYDLLWWYAAPVGALGFNDNSIDFRVEPGSAAGEPARITWQPRSPPVQFENRSVTVAAGRPFTLDFGRVPGTDRIFAFGQIPRDATARTEYVAVKSPAHYTGAAFRDALERRGIRVDRAEVRVHSDPQTSPARGAQPLVEHRSPPLAQIIGPILGSSQNWFAEQLLKTLGRETRGEGSWEAGLAVERDFLLRVVGVDSAAFLLRDASGLSAGNLITPHALVQLLAFAREMPHHAIFRQSLPVSGRSGSLRSRLADLDGRVAAKTGYIGNVDALSGYLESEGGRELIFSIVANASGLPSTRVKAAIDEVVRVVATAAPR